MRKQWLFLAASLLLALPAYAQRSTATIRGTVTDSSKAIVPGASVTARNEDTGLTRTTVTNTSGVFLLPELPVGRYRVDAELQGFKTASRTQIPLRVADDYVVDFELEPGELTETVSVEAASTPVKVLGGDVSGLITGEQVRELPLNGRNFIQLATLMPGVNAPDMLNVKDKGLLGGSDLSVSGGDVTANLWTVDGANNNDVGSNRTLLVYPSLEAIEEFKILRNSYGPEFGQSGGAQINIVTRSGTNQYRGSVFYSGRNDALNGTNYFLEQANQPKEELSRHDFGGSFGGPILRDKVHFFGAMEWNLEDRGTVRNEFVPTDAERRGDFSSPIPGCTPPGPVIDPLTGAPFPGNIIPADRISPAGQAYLNLYPSPNVTPSGNSCNNWITSLTTPLDWQQYHIRADWTVNNASRLMVRYTHDSWKNDSPSLQSNLWGDDAFPAVDSNWDQPSDSFVTQFSQTFGTSATNSLQFSYSANKITVSRGGLDAALNSRLLTLIPPIFPVDSKEYGAEIGHPLFWSSTAYPTLWNEAPFRNNQDLFVLKDDYTAVFGKHFVKAGVLASFNHKNEDSSGNGSSENSQFWGSTGLNGWGGATGNILADFLLRDMAFGFSEISAQRQVPQRWRDVEMYVADSWQVSPRVTFDYGVRYSLLFNPYAADDRIMSFVPEQFNAALGADACNGLLQPPGTTFCQDAGALGGAAGPNRSLVDQDYNNFAPRLGVAWDLSGDGKTAIRSGLGLFYLRERLSPGLNIAGNPPFVITQTGTRTLDTNVPCDGCFDPANIGVPATGREVEAATPHNWQWNVSFQHEVWRNTTIDVAYVGNYGYDLLRNHDVNQVLSGDIDGNGVDDRLQYARGATADVRRFGVFGDRSITQWDHSGESSYNSLQAQFISRFGRGSQFQTSYTLARSRANLSLTDSSGGLSNSVSSLDLQNPDADFGRPETGRTHIFNVSMIYMAPSLEGQSAVMRHVFGDWEISTIIGAASGAPLDVFVSGALPLLGTGPSGTGNWQNLPAHERPNFVGPCKADGGLPEQILNPSAYTLDGFQLGTIGTGRRGDCDGPGYFQVDLSFYKNFNLAGNMRVQFRWDIFNIFNNTNFISGVGGPNFNNTLSPDDIVLDSDDPATATRIVSAAVPRGFGQATRARDPRQMQIGFKLLF